MTPPNQKRQFEPLPLDLETAPAEPRKPHGFRAYVGGVLYIEGLVVFFMGITLLTTYWPPIAARGEPANPVSKLGLWLVSGSLFYMVVVGLCIFAYNLLRPGSLSAAPRPNEPGAVKKARRYASMKRRTRYIFDDTINCESDAEEACKARDLF